MCIYVINAKMLKNVLYCHFGLCRNGTILHLSALIFCSSVIFVSVSVFPSSMFLSMDCVACNKAID